MPRAKLSLLFVTSFAVLRTGVAVCAVALLIASGNLAQAGVIVSGEDDCAGISSADAQGSSPGERSDSTDQQLTGSSDFALPTDAGNSTNTNSGASSSTAGVSAILPQAGGISSSALSAGLCEERALRLPPSPFFDHLRPPRA